MMPGGITVSKAVVRAFYHESGRDVDSWVVQHLIEWRDSVPVGTTVPVTEATYRPVGVQIPPGEIVLEHLFPDDGPCLIPGIVGVVVHGPLWEFANGRPKMIQRIY